MSGYIYLIQTREFIKTNEKIFKIGRTYDIDQRMSGYPKGSRVFFTYLVPNVVLAETELVQLFKTKYAQQLDIGREYFMGASEDMAETIVTHVRHTQQFDMLSNVTLTQNTIKPPQQQKGTKAKPHIIVINNQNNVTPSRTKTDNKQIPYTCVRCGYITGKRSNMMKHLYEKIKTCPATHYEIVLTDEIKTYILDNRVYRIPNKYNVLSIAINES